MLAILLLNYYCILQSASIVIQPKGPTHRNYAVECINEVTKHAYDFTRAENNRLSQLLLTYVVTTDLNTPGYEIQEEALNILHSQTVWCMEVLQYGGRAEFESYSEDCDMEDDYSSPSPNQCVRKHVMHLKTHLYVIIFEDLETFSERLSQLVEASSFNSEALCIIYYAKISGRGEKIAPEVIKALYEYSFRNIILMIPKDIKTFGLYKLNFQKDIGMRCYSIFNITMPFQCSEGKLRPHGINVYHEPEAHNHFKCFEYVQALPYEPYIISRTRGIETDIIHEIGRALNISFKIRVYPNIATYLGEKNDNGTWSGFVHPIYHHWHLGIGNIQPETALAEDFSYSVGYHWIKIVFIVPIARYVPRWRVLMAIFKVEIWGICLAVIFGFAIAFCTFKTKREVRTFKTFEKCLESAFQILIAHPIPAQPICNFTRVYFISLAFFAIIINSVYTSSLISFLQNPIREHQISTRKEVATRLVVGGSPRHMEMFKTPQGQFGTMIAASYQTVNESLDTYRYWLKKVADDRNLSTIVTHLCVSYLISKGNPIVVDRRGEPKVFMLPKPLRVQPIGILMRKGHFLENPCNKIIQKLIIEGGLINKIKGHYARTTVETAGDPNILDEESSSSEVAALSPHHLEGLFVILALGEACGILVLILEIAYYHIKKLHRKKTK